MNADPSWRRGPLLLVAAAIALLTVAGTALWIAGVARPAPRVAEAAMLSATMAGRTLVIVIDAGRADPIGRAAATLDSYARALATGRIQARVMELRVDRGGRPFMRLVFDGGVLASGAVAGGAPAHLLDLAGDGSRWPARDDAAVQSYCGRIETADKPFCANGR